MISSSEPLAASTNIRAQTWRYAMAVTFLAACTGFFDIGHRFMNGDEAQYALCVDNIHQTGQWLSISPFPPHPYFQKPPLYMWLCAATYDLFPGDVNLLRYRFWSAAFATATAGLTVLLGARLLTPKVGLLAGVLLVTNDDFLRNHGARWATMDTGVTLATLVAILIYLGRAKRGQTAAWVWVGVAAGIASMLKPIAGLPTLLLLAIDHLAIAGNCRRPNKWAGPALATAICLAVAAPWYLLQWHRFGDVFVDQMFRVNLVERAAVGFGPQIKSVIYYPWRISLSSYAFILMTPALGYLVYRGWKDAAGGGLRCLAVFSIGWLVVFSVSRSKLLHYAYPFFPVIAVAIAALLWDGVKRIVTQPTAAALLIVGLLAADAIRVGLGIRHDHHQVFEPWEFYKTYAQQVMPTQRRVGFLGFGANVFDWQVDGLDARDCFYLQHMEAHERLFDPQTLEAFLQAPMPALVVIRRDGETGAGDWPAVAVTGRLDRARYRMEVIRIQRIP